MERIGRIMVVAVWAYSRIEISGRSGRRRRIGKIGRSGEDWEGCVGWE